MFQLLNARLRHRRGSALTEYGILAGLIAVVSIGAVSRLGEELEFDYLVGALNVYETHSPLGNFLVNGDFDDPTGMSATSWGYYGGSIEGWVSNNGQPFELHQSGWQGMDSVNGGYWLDTNASPGRLDIEQAVQNLTADLVYKVTLYAGDRDADLDGEAMVYWNGEYLGRLDPTVQDVMQEFTFHIQEGSGDGTNVIRILDSGANDSNGLSLDEVRIWGP